MIQPTYQKLLQQISNSEIQNSNMQKKIISNQYQNFKQWFIKLGFWKKLILIFAINTLTILIVMNILMEVLFNKVNDNIQSISKDETNQYISISNSLVGILQTNSLLTGVEIFADFLVQIDSSLHFFRQRTDIYISLLSSVPPYNPPLASQFTSVPDIRKPAIYFYGPNSTFHDEPYIDLLLSSLLSGIQAKQLKRINIIYQSLTNPTDIFARTIPGTNDFVIPSVQDVNDRMKSIQKDYISASSLYNDTLTLSATKSELFALRTIQYFGDYKILIQVEIYQKTLEVSLGRLFYYPSAKIVLLKVVSDNPSMYKTINIDSFELDLTPCIRSSYQLFALQNGTLLDAQSIAINESFYIGQSPFIISQNQLQKMNSTIGSFRLVLLTNKEQLSTSNMYMSGFLSNQKNTLSYIIYGWSFVILLSTIGLSIVTGDYIFYNLKTLSTKLHQYTKQPLKIHKIIFQLKELQCTGIIKKLVDNVITIVEKIEQRKKNKNSMIAPIIYPLNIAEKQFGIKHNLGDQNRWDRWKRLLLERESQVQAQKQNQNQTHKQSQKINQIGIHVSDGKNSPPKRYNKRQV